VSVRAQTRRSVSILEFALLTNGESNAFVVPSDADSGFCRLGNNDWSRRGSHRADSRFASIANSVCPAQMLLVYFFHLLFTRHLLPCHSRFSTPTFCPVAVESKDLTGTIVHRSNLF